MWEPGEAFGWGVQVEDATGQSIQLGLAALPVNFGEIALPALTHIGRFGVRGDTRT
jgi:hypothetical protein